MCDGAGRAGGRLDRGRGDAGGVGGRLGDLPDRRGHLLGPGDDRLHVVRHLGRRRGDVLRAAGGVVGGPGDGGAGRGEFGGGTGDAGGGLGHRPDGVPDAGGGLAQGGGHPADLVAGVHRGGPGQIPGGHRGEHGSDLTQRVHDAPGGVDGQGGADQHAGGQQNDQVGPGRVVGVAGIGHRPGRLGGLGGGGGVERSHHLFHDRVGGAGRHRLECLQIPGQRRRKLLAVADIHVLLPQLVELLDRGRVGGMG